ncbi:MAG: L-2-amino-thiazoline-4-carboxylic acid hydrolase, partial [Promethearchaeota archaeon]
MRIEDIENGIHIITPKWPIAEVYTSLGRQKYGKSFHCFTDPYICAGFNPDIKYEKKRSLMAGNKYCEHYYQI